MLRVNLKKEPGDDWAVPKDICGKQNSPLQIKSIKGEEFFLVENFKQLITELLGRVQNLKKQVKKQYFSEDYPLY